MATKTVTLILLGADRQLWHGGKSRLQVTDVTRSHLKILTNQKLGPESHTVLLNLDLAFDAGQTYGISVDVTRHRSAWQLLRRNSFIRREGTEEVEVKDIFMRLMLVPRKTSSADLDTAYDRLLARGSPMVADPFGISKPEYLALKAAAKMALLNIEAKLRETRLGGRPLLSFVEKVRCAEVDRVFLFVRSELKALIEQSPDFASAPGHGSPDAPIPLPAHPDSWKHRRFGAGNIQISLSESAELLPGNPAK